MSDGEITLREYFNEKFSELKQSMHELKQEIRTNQIEMRSQVYKMESDINQRMCKLEHEVNEFIFIKKYWKIFAFALVLFVVGTIYTVKKQLNEVRQGNIENVIGK